ncbi:DUF397 domain-containing protein [Streptomyces collinus]|uniref:DUF397 domain-containing protein n=1 Tax=Streptomyces collinus TaxID=42684 RepID=UPI002942C415|nr:DUF397 domain-containing protein [Streptomyces collinus]
MSSTALRWVKSSYSSEEGGNCVEVATESGSVHIRDSKTPASPHLTVTAAAWAAFLKLPGRG